MPVRGTKMRGVTSSSDSGQDLSLQWPWLEAGGGEGVGGSGVQEEKS